MIWSVITVIAMMPETKKLMAKIQICALVSEVKKKLKM